MLMAKLFQEIQKHRKVQFGLTFLVMDPGYNKENRELIESNAKVLGIPAIALDEELAKIGSSAPDRARARPARAATDGYCSRTEQTSPGPSVTTAAP